MPKVFKLVCPNPISSDEAAVARDSWLRETEGTDLEGSVLLLLSGGVDIHPLSEGAVLELAADALDKRGRHVYAAELRKLAGETT